MAHHLTDLTVEMDDKPGIVAATAEALGKAGVNIEAFAGMATGGGKGMGHILVEDVQKAPQALEGTGTRVIEERPVLVLDLEDRPGALGKLTRKIADAGVNLNLVYLATRTRVVIGAKDLEKARAAAGQAATASR